MFMKATSLWGCGLAIALTASVPTVVLAADISSLDEHLEPLRPLLGKTYRGVFKNSKPESPTVDVARWERALNGKAVRLLHSVNDGIYGGETIFVWDAKKQAVAFYYFTTAGYLTTGTLTSKDGVLLTKEEVAGNAGGVTEVKATSKLGAEGTLHVKSEYLKDGDWVPGHEITYQEDSSATVAFK
jgi:hypothetical protein